MHQITGISFCLDDQTCAACTGYFVGIGLSLLFLEWQVVNLFVRLIPFLKVLASFICPLGVKIDEDATIDDISLDISDEHITNVLPSLPDIFMNSCLIPTLASYLRNDSGMRAIPLCFFWFV